MLKGIVFDLDGTLVDSLSVTFDAFNHGIVRQGGRVHTPEEIIQYFGPGEGEIFGRIIGPDKAQAAYDDFREYLDRNLGNVPLHAGVEELLERIKSSGIPVAIVTGRSWNTTELILNHHRILDRFITVVANDHVASPKPSPEGIRLALSRLKLQPSEAAYVGDMWVDIRAAHSAGCQSIAALWDLMVSRDALLPHNPHHWAEKAADVWQVWEKARGI